ncbi:hypothetical protein IVG45_19025 [Methylomonas sp. LL1]|uniref:hypothetical protein n=1 Tax=Methylomonas sp. LL1 TaxID=2785785 RepID=UPI0018C3D843|nr:hypothetical protein [Methylomonas sp. LL1]QPK62895.1 hypothetical protein IVG45_19025 [Methylomonas sp. LL1]
MNEQLIPNEDNQDDIEVITREEFQNLQADRIENEVFGGEENAKKAAGLIQQFVSSYGKNKDRVVLEQWLTEEFRRFPTIWKDQEELENTAHEIIVSVQRANDAKQSLYAHLDKGKSKESWLTKQIESGAAASGAATVGTYAKSIDDAIKAANEGMRATVFNKDGINISGNSNLDGFIAEQHHIDTFNLDAASKGKTYRAVRLDQDGRPYGKNSVDIVIYDDKGVIKRKYQSKYGKDADATGKLFEKGDYRGQTKVVPEGHAEEIDRARETIEYDGVESKPLSKEEAKTLQEKARQQEEVKQYDWNEVNRINIAKNIGKQIFIGAAITSGLQGARILGRRTWNWIVGKENPPVSEDMKDFFESSIKSCKHIGVQVAVSGAVVVAVKNGWLGQLLKDSPAGHIVNAVYVGMENAKILYKLANGEMIAPEALDAMGNVTTSAIGGIAGAGWGIAEGTTIGTALGGPVGAVIGGFVGGVIGGMAGSKIGEAVYSGGKVIVKTAAKVLKSAWETTKEVALNAGRALNPLNWFA